jgi:hypothetical protein
VDLIKEAMAIEAAVKDLQQLSAANRREFDRQQEELKELHTALEAQMDLLRRYKAALEGLTPGGSEFVNDPENCARYVREAMIRQHETIKRFKYRGDALILFVERVEDIATMNEVEANSSVVDIKGRAEVLDDLILKARALERGKT